MRHTGRPVALIATLTILIAFLGVAQQAHAQTVAGPGQATTPSGGSTSSSKGLAKVVSGVKAYRAGKMDTAISALTVATSGGGLSSKDLAKALYYRGLAYRRKQKPAEAIADLTSAIWLKGGLSQTERTDAIKNRTKAYKEAGIQDPGVEASASKGPPPAQTAATPSGKPGSWQTATNGQPGSAKPTAVTSAPSTNTFGGVGTFFSNLFSGSGTTSTTQPSTQTRSTESIALAPNASIPAPIPPSTGKKSGSASAAARSALSTPSTGPAAVSGWSSKTQVKTLSPPPQKTAARTAQPPKTAPTAPAKPAAPVKPAKPTGKYSVRIAALRSRDEAQKVISQFQTKHASALGGRNPSIETQSFGNMGTFYNVQVGPFKQPKDYKALCLAARSSGYDCLVIKK